MTNIDKLEGRELDAVVAERVMGWVVQHTDPPIYATEAETMLEAWKEVPHFSTRLTDAQKVSQWLIERGCIIEFTLYPEGESSCRIIKYPEAWTAFYDTPEEALCRAALKAVAPVEDAPD